MRVDSAFSVKSLEGAAPGELLRFRFAETVALAIAAHERGEFFHRYAILRLEGRPAQVPFHCQFKPEGYCVSFGQDWELQLLPGEETLPGNRRFAERPGVVYTFESQRLLRLEGPQPGEAASYMGLASSRFTPNCSPDAAPVARWKIWSRPGLSTQAGATPLFEFALKQGKAGSLPRPSVAAVQRRPAG